MRPAQSWIPASAVFTARSVALAVATILLVGAQPASAQTARSGGAGGNAQLVQQLQQLASERTTLQAEQARMKKEIEDLRKERDSLKASQAAAGKRNSSASEAAVTRVTRERDALEAELTKTRANTQELIAKFRETAQALREVETDRATAKQALAARMTDLDSCVKSNDALYKLNDEVLTHFGDQGFWSRVGQVEPFTRLKRVELENIVESYRYRAEDQKLSLGTNSPQK
jgi:chromosome segregation ATPase